MASPPQTSTNAPRISRPRSLRSSQSHNRRPLRPARVRVPPPPVSTAAATGTVSPAVEPDISPNVSPNVSSLAPRAAPVGLCPRVKQFWAKLHQVRHNEQTKPTQRVEYIVPPPIELMRVGIPPDEYELIGKQKADLAMWAYHSDAVHPARLLAVKLYTNASNVAFGITAEVTALEKIKENPHPRCLSFVDDPDFVSVRRMPEYDMVGIIMEYHPCSLTPLCGRYPPEALAGPLYATVAAELTSGLMHLHHLGMVHRDLKPDNILIDRTGHCIIADYDSTFHHSPFAPRCTDTHMIGTIGYIAPEMRQREPAEDLFVFDYRADYWSLGMTLFELVSFFADEWMQKWHEGRGPAIEEHLRRATVCPGAFKEVLLALLEDDPQQRLRGQELVDQLAALGAGGESGSCSPFIVEQHQSHSTPRWNNRFEPISNPLTATRTPPRLSPIHIIEVTPGRSGSIKRPTSGFSVPLSPPETPQRTASSRAPAQRPMGGYSPRGPHEPKSLSALDAPLQAVSSALFGSPEMLERVDETPGEDTIAHSEGSSTSLSRVGRVGRLTAERKGKARASPAHSRSNSTSGHLGPGGVAKSTKPRTPSPLGTSASLNLDIPASPTRKWIVHNPDPVSSKPEDGDGTGTGSDTDEEVRLERWTPRPSTVTASPSPSPSSAQLSPEIHVHGAGDSTSLQALSALEAHHKYIHQTPTHSPLVGAREVPVGAQFEGARVERATVLRVPSRTEGGSPSKHSLDPELGLGSKVGFTDLLKTGPGLLLTAHEASVAGQKRSSSDSQQVVQDPEDAASAA
ncbi:Protein kinase C delta type [Mycena chlorophos]|uniref:Protein kinase C delta type n=1 Tax=Mycena chlorophos TaxID=658473 RepID=A0A8H6S052_MYCCL|nr:Protein kinase C delta type [Mycena chlorophos]